MVNRRSGADIQEIIDRSAYHQLFLPEVLKVDHEAPCLTIKYAMSDVFERQPGTDQWHGRTISAVVDTTGCYALTLITDAPPPTINFRTDFLRPGIQTDLTALAMVRCAGRSVEVVDVEVNDDNGRLVALGRSSCALPR